MFPDSTSCFCVEVLRPLLIEAGADLLLFDPATVDRGAKRRVHDLPGGAPRLTTPAIGVHGVWVNGTRIVAEDGALIADAARDAAQSEAIADALRAIPNPLVNEAITVTVLAGITGSASGGMGIALAAMSETFIENAHAAGIPLEVFHRVASMASGGMDTLPHNGAVITLLAVTGLTHRQSYKDIFAITCIKTLAVFVVIATFYLTGIV